MREGGRERESKSGGGPPEMAYADDAILLAKTEADAMTLLVEFMKAFAIVLKFSSLMNEDWI